MGLLDGLGGILGSGLGSLIPGFGAVAGSLVQAKSQEDTNSANATEAFKNRKFQEDMSNTAYQRATKDMQAAGINPMLAFSQGGASSGSGAQATMQNPFEGVANSLQGAVSSVMQLQDLKNKTEMTASQVKNLDAETEKAKAGTENTQAQTEKTKQETVAPQEVNPRFKKGLQMIDNVMNKVLHWGDSSAKKTKETLTQQEIEQGAKGFDPNYRRKPSPQWGEMQ